VVLQESRDLVAEADELHAFLGTLEQEDWGRPTAFKGWTPWDVVAHLHFYDRVSLVSLEGREAFAARRDALVKELLGGATNAELARREFGDLPPAALRERWIDTCREMARQLGESPPERRLPWFGPDMGVRMFTTARLMETWAHGQEVYDLMGAERVPTDRLRHIATLGVKTFGWTFANRRLEPPGPPPYVRLVAPSGAIWEWNEPREGECVRGDALDFCQVVTQTRSVADTRLEVVGPVATRWMSIAQCFAGPPADPPKPGERVRARA
jgi:uncharacterized protein (TIGR03084 family)